MSLLQHFLARNQRQVSGRSARFTARRRHLQRSLCPLPWCWAVQSCSHPAVLPVYSYSASQTPLLAWLKDSLSLHSPVMCMRLCEQTEGRGGSTHLGKNREDTTEPFCTGLQLDQFGLTWKSQLRTCITLRVSYSCIRLQGQCTSSLTAVGLAVPPIAAPPLRWISLHLYKHKHG